MAKERLIESLNIKVEPSTKELLTRAANELYPDVPGNVSVLIRQFVKRFLIEHDAAKKRSK